MAISNPNGIAMMAGLPQDSSMGLGSFANSNNGMQPRHLGQTIQDANFSSSHNAPQQRGVVSHMSMPYGGLASMVQHLHQDQQQQQQIRHQPPQHEQLASIEQQLHHLQAPLMRSVIRHNSAPPLGMMQNISSQLDAINLLGNQLQQHASPFQSNFADLQSNTASHNQVLNSFLSSGMNMPDSMSHLPPPRRVPVKGLGQGGGGGGLRSQFKREASDNSIGLDGMLNGPTQLTSIMDLSMSENLDDDIVAPMRVQERKPSGARQGYGGGMDMDMSATTLDRMSDFGESTTRFSESTNNISFSNVFEDNDKDYVYQNR